MGGCIALTVRFDEDRAYRGSCWTNTLPGGMWTAPFYIDLDSSKRHVDTWLGKLLVHRATDPVLEDMWGGWNKLAPLQYGIMIIDYVTSTAVSAQGYHALDWTYRPVEVDELTRDMFEDKIETWHALEKAGLLLPSRRVMGPHFKVADIKLPFAHTIFGDADKADRTLMKWCEDNIGLSDDERTEWEQWFKDQEE